MQSSIYSIIFFALTPLTSTSMNSIKNILNHKNISSSIQTIPNRTHYSKSIHYLEEKLKFIENKESDLTKQCSKILKLDIGVHEKMNLVKNKALLLKKIINVKQDLAFNVEQLKSKNSFYNTINYALKNIYTEIHHTNDIEHAVKSMQKLIDEENDINEFKQKLNAQYNFVFQRFDDNFTFPE